MHKLLFTLLVATTLLTTSTVAAKEKYSKTSKVTVRKKTTVKAASGFTPYLGVDAQWRHLDFQHQLGKDLFEHDYPQGNVYLGIKLNDFLGIEAGLESTVRKNRTTLIDVGETPAGVSLQAPTQYSSTAEIKGPHINLVFTTPLNQYCMRFVGLIGMAHLKAKFVRNADFIIFGGVPVPPILVSPTTNFEKRKNILRLGLGIEHLFTHNWGFRTMLGWENTQKFDISTNQPPIEVVGTNNSMTYSIGTFVKF